MAAAFIGAIDEKMVAEKPQPFPADGSIIPLAIIPIGYKHKEERHFDPEMRKKLKTLRQSTNQIHWGEVGLN